MVFPQTVLTTKVEMYLNGAWVDVTASPIYNRAGVVITRGRSDEGTDVDRMTARFQINNRSGNFSPRNPMSTYYGSIGRNTPCRISVDGATPYLMLVGDTSSKATTPDLAALDIVGDIDVRMDLFLSNWRLTTGVDFLGKYVTAGNQRSWAFGLGTGGGLFFRWSADGTTVVEETSSVDVPAPGSGRQTVRATLRVNNGAGTYECRFWTSDSITGTFTQLGTTKSGAGVTSIFSSSAGVELGDVANLTSWPINGRVYKASIRNGIAGTEVANPDFTIQTVGATTFTDAAGRVWTVAGTASISKKRYRFHGEVSAWPQRWDTTGRDVYVPVEAAGVLRRIAQGGQVQGSALYRGITRDSPNLVAYWPLEDLDGSTAAAPALSTHGPMSKTGSPRFAAFTSFHASDPIVIINDGVLEGKVPSYTVGTDTQVRFLMAVPAAGAENNQVLLMFYTTGTCRRFEVFYSTGGALGLRAFDVDNVSLFTSGPISFAVDGKLMRISVELAQSGANINWNLLTLEPGALTGLSFSGTLATNTVGRVGSVTVSPGGGVVNTAFGHVSVQNLLTSLYDLGPQLEAWRGERAGRRIERLCREEGVAFWCLGDIDESTKMSYQVPGELLTLLRECANADHGMLYEPRDILALGYRTRQSLYNQTARLPLSYTANQLSDSLDPVDDDQGVRNDVTATRPNGSSARATLDVGALSIQAPPNGVGRYDVSDTVSVEFDQLLIDHVTWLLRLGTVDEARYPKIAINRARSQIYGNASLDDAVLSAEVGDRITVSNLPNWLPPELVSQLVQGYTENLNNFEHSFIFNTAPESPYQVAVYGDAQARYQAVDSTLAGTMTTTSVSVSVSTLTPPVWTTTVGDFPFDIMVAGERMTVTAITGATSPQTFTVTRSINGIVKTHAIGETVELFYQSVYAL